MRVMVLPETGGRIYSIVHKPSDTEFMWHHPRNIPRVVPFGSSFDDTFIGGWDELLPTADPCNFRGEAIPNHGELWALPWEWQVTTTGEGAPCLYTSAATPITPIRFERWLTLDAEQPQLHVRYRLTSLAPYPLDLLWGIHPLFAISPQHRLDLSASRMLVALSSKDQFGGAGQEYEWPHMPYQEGVTDMRRMPPASAAAFAGHYAVAPSEPWFALTHQQTQVGIAMVYPPEVFKALWIWMSFGGWRGLYHAAVEPWTGYPVRLDQAVEAGRQVVLKPAEQITYDVTVLAYSGLSQVSHIKQAGTHFTVLP